MPPQRRRRRRPFTRVVDLLGDARHAAMRGLRRITDPIRRGLGLLTIPVFALGRLLRRIRRAISDFWFRRSLSFRRRTALVLLVLIAYAVIRWASVPGVPCSISEAKACPPSDDAIALVPEDSLVYLHANLDRDSSQFESASDLAAQLPHFATIESGVARLAGLRAGDLNAKWIGDEAAIAEVAPRESLMLIAVDDKEGADRYAASLGPGPATTYRNVQIDIHRAGLTSAPVGDFLALGPKRAVESAIDVQDGKAESLEHSDVADAVRDRLPGDRLADAYVSPGGIAKLLAGRSGLPSQLDTFTDYGASRGIGAALVAHDDGLELQIESLLDAGRAKANPPFFAAFNEFTPSLAGVLPPQTVIYLGINNPSETVRLLLQQADIAAPGISDAFRRFNSELRQRGHVDIARGVLPLLDGETAVGITPARPVPYLTAIFSDIDEEKVRNAIARLQAPIIAALRPELTGQVPNFKTKTIDGIVTHTVQLSPQLDLSYAVWDGKLVVSTSAAGVSSAVAGDTHLAGEENYQSVSSVTSGGLSALVFLNLEGLVKLLEPLGLNSIAPYAAFKSDFARLRALGLSVKSGEDSLETKLFLDIS